MVFEQNQGDNYNIDVFFYRSFVSHKMRLSFNNSNRNGFFFFFLFDLRVFFDAFGVFDLTGFSS